MERAVARTISAIKRVQRWFVPPKGTLEWQRILYQPMLYLCLWIAVLVIIHRGDFTNIPPETSDKQNELFWAWSAVGIVSPPIGLISLWFIYKIKNGLWKYWGFWLRLAADIGMATAMLCYCIFRFDVGDYHVYTMATTVSSTIFVFHLVLRDCLKLYEIEAVASQLQLQWEEEKDERHSISSNR